MAHVELAIAMILRWVAMHQAVLIPLALLIVADLKTSLTAYPKAETILGIFFDLLSFHQHSDSPGTLKMLGTRSKPPTVLGQPIPLSAPMASSRMKTPTPGAKLTGLLLLLVLGSATARADVVITSGPSLPMLEFTGQTHPVSFAPGLGYQLSVGLFQFAALNQQWDALNLGLAVFGNVLSSATGDQVGSGQVALTVGTLNNLLAVGVAMSVFGVGSAAAGLPKFYPVLSFNIPISWTPLIPPVGYAPGPAGLPRGGTLYFGGGARQ
jgi:hypothetical protein